MPTVIEIFRENVERFGGKPCLHFKRDGVWQTLSWTEVGRLVDSLAGQMVRSGIKKGDNVGIFSSTRFEWTIADLATMSLGAVVVPIYTSLSAEYINQIISETNARMLFVEDLTAEERIRSAIGGLKISIKRFDQLDLTETFPSADLSISPEDIASVIYTSGTTGRQKGVIVPHSMIMAEVMGLKKGFALGNDDILLAILPLAHVLARSIQFFQLISGCQTAYAESLEAVPKNLEEVRPHMVVAVPRFVEKIYERMSAQIEERPALIKKIVGWGISVGAEYSKYAKRKERAPLRLRLKYAVADAIVFSRLRRALGGRIKFLVSGGAPLAEDLAKFFFGAGLLIIEGYGLTETFAAIVVNRLDDFHFGTVGKPLPGVDVKIAPDGEILIKGDMVFKGYLGDPDETARSFTKDGWFLTGDVGEFSRDGFLRITDRKKDLIVTSGGKNIAPQAIEALIEESPYISHVVVFGEKRKYITAIITLNLDEVKKFAGKNGIRYASDADLSASPRIKDMIAKVIEEKNRKLSHFETVKKFAIVPADFAIETGELTPTMKVKRRIVEEKYGDILERLYDN